MKKILYSLFVCLVFASCDENTQDTSKITYFVDFEMIGDQIITLPKGDTYVEPGVIAMEGENDISNTIETIGTVDSSTLGLYEIEYKAVNVDGFASSIIRKVIVYEGDFSDIDLTGSYISSTILDTGSAQQTTYSGGTVTITKVTKGVFNVSCLLGSWYLVRYPGYNMAAPGLIQLSGNNSITNFGGIQLYWSYVVTDAGGGFYDPATEHIHLNSGMQGMKFLCDMSKK